MNNTLPLSIKLEKNLENYNFSLFLLNHGKNKYSKIELLSGAFMSSDEELIETGKMFKQFENIIPGSFITLDSSDLGELDFVIWYNIDCFLETGELEKYKFEIFKWNEGKVEYRDWESVSEYISKNNVKKI